MILILCFILLTLSRGRLCLARANSRLWGYKVHSCFPLILHHNAESLLRFLDCWHMKVFWFLFGVAKSSTSQVETGKTDCMESKSRCSRLLKKRDFRLIGFYFSFILLKQARVKRRLSGGPRNEGVFVFFHSLNHSMWKQDFTESSNAKLYDTGSTEELAETLTDGFIILRQWLTNELLIWRLGYFQNENLNKK